MIQDTRIRFLNEALLRPGAYVLYWMQQSQRVGWNHALEHAVERGNELGLPVVVGFGLTDSYPEANERHYSFMLDGLHDVERDLAARGIRFVLRVGSPDEVALELAADAALLVTDRGYLRHQVEWRRKVAEGAACQVVQVESDAVVPVETASSREEVGARTLRPKIARLLPDYLVPLEPRHTKVDALGLRMNGESLEDPAALLARLGVDRGVSAVEGVRGGASEAEACLEEFLSRKLSAYAADRNDPSLSGQSGLSPYLHFGQISPLQVALAVSERGSRCEESTEAFLEELIVRRELSLNFVRYNAEYDTFRCLPDWARTTLLEHAYDPREPSYGKEELESAQTHDPYWNAAQRELLMTGRMHGYMRMYWGKKIIEWTPDPEEAFCICLALNNKYFLDGRDPASYGNVAWLFGKHDRPWRRRPIFGTVRYMNESGLRRKFDMDGYLARVTALGRPERG